MDETRSENAYERTAKLAYELWELRGCPEGSPKWIGRPQKKC